MVGENIQELIIAVILIGVASFVARLLQWHLFLGRRLRGKLYGNVDTWQFLIGAKKLKENNYRIADTANEAGVDADKYYPPLFFYLTAFLPKNLVKHAPAFADAFLSLILTASVVLITGNWVAGVLAAGVYLSSPAIFQQTFCFCPRPLSILLVSLICLFSLSASWLNFFAVAVLSATVFLLHKFATQILVFSSVAFLLILRFDYPLAVLLGFAVAVGASKGYYLKVLKAHITHLKSSYLKRFIQNQAGSSLKKTAALLDYCPWFIFILAVPQGVALAPTLIWILTLLVLAVATNFWKLKIVGEGWRYLGYLTFPLALWIANAVVQSPNLLWLYAVFAVSGIAIGYFYTLRLFRRHQPYLIDEADISFFKQTATLKGRTITTVPKEFTYPVAFFSGKEYIAKPDIDFEGKAMELAEIIIIDKRLTVKRMELEKRGYAPKLENHRWTACMPEGTQ